VEQHQIQLCGNKFDEVGLTCGSVPWQGGHTDDDDDSYTRNIMREISKLEAQLAI